MANPPIRKMAGNLNICSVDMAGNLKMWRPKETQYKNGEKLEHRVEMAENLKIWPPKETQ